MPSKSFCWSHVGGFVFSVIGIHMRCMLNFWPLYFVLCTTFIESKGLKPSFSISHFLNHGLQWFSKAIVAKPEASFSLFVMSSTSCFPKLCPFAFLKTQMQFMTIMLSPIIG